MSLPVAVPRPKWSRKTLPVLGILLLLCLIGLLGKYDISAAASRFLWMQVLFLGVGCLFYVFSDRILPVIAGSTFRELWAHIGMMIAGTLCITLIYYFKGGDYAFLSAIIAFIIPYVVGRAWWHFNRMPDPVYKKWYYPLEGDMPDVDLVDLSKILVIQFEMTKKAGDALLTNFKTKAPVNMTLGELFLIFINDYNENNQEFIGVVDDQKSPYGWVFYLQKGFFKRKRYLDPDYTFYQNHNMDNDIVRAERVFQ